MAPSADRAVRGSTLEERREAARTAAAIYTRRGQPVPREIAAILTHTDSSERDRRIRVIDTMISASGIFVQITQSVLDVELPLSQRVASTLRALDGFVASTATNVGEFSRWAQTQDYAMQVLGRSWSAIVSGFAGYLDTVRDDFGYQPTATSIAIKDVGPIVEQARGLTSGDAQLDSVLATVIAQIDACLADLAERTDDRVAMDSYLVAVTRVRRLFEHGYDDELASEDDRRELVGAMQDYIESSGSLIGLSQNYVTMLSTDPGADHAWFLETTFKQLDHDDEMLHIWRRVLPELIRLHPEFRETGEKLAAEVDDLLGWSRRVRRQIVKLQFSSLTEGIFWADLDNTERATLEHVERVEREMA